MVNEIALRRSFGLLIILMGIFLVGAWFGAYAFGNLSFNKNMGELLIFICLIFLGCLINLYKKKGDKK